MVATSSHSASSSDPPGIFVVKTDYVDAKPLVPEFESVRLYPTQTRFVTGIARAYDDDFPPELSHLVKQEDFDTAINQINNTMKDYWPCWFCMCCGYVCCPCTFGISLMCPNLCIRDAEQYVRALIQRINKRACFSKVGVEWHLERSCGRSWLEISYPVTRKPIISESTYQGPLLGLEPPNGSSRHSSYASNTSTVSSRSTASSPLIVDV